MPVFCISALIKKWIKIYEMLLNRNLFHGIYSDYDI